MTQVFDSKFFIKEISEELIQNFDRASRATTPGLKGAARENEIRKKLENLLPRGVGIGTGCVIDHEGNASRQQDIILFEKDLCPAFSINDTAESTYYPCEGVIAVGEVKTQIGKEEIKDSFSKIESVKKLRRLPIKSKSVLTGNEIISFRKYLNSGAFDCALEEIFDQDKNSNDQIYGFVICGSFSLKVDTICEHISTQSSLIDRKLLPNLIVSLNDGIVSPYHEGNNSLCRAVMNGTGYLYGHSTCGSFEHLLANLHQIIHQGRTVEIKAFERYIIQAPEKMSVTIRKIVPVK